MIPQGGERRAKYVFRVSEGCRGTLNVRLGHFARGNHQIRDQRIREAASLCSQRLAPKLMRAIRGMNVPHAWQVDTHAAGMLGQFEEGSRDKRGVAVVPEFFIFCDGRLSGMSDAHDFSPL